MTQDRNEAEEADALRLLNPLGAILYLLLLASVAAAILPGTGLPI